jgi:hypothetical protein
VEAGGSIDAPIARSTGQRYAFSIKWQEGISITTPSTPQSAARFTSSTMHREKA